MKTIDLEGELIAAAKSVRQPHLDRLRSLGISPAVMAGIGRFQTPFGVSGAERLSDGYYRPGDGPCHVISPVYVDGQLIDLIAWQTRDPTSWASRTGLSWALGEDILTMRWAWERPVAVHATPLAWWIAACDGLCILDWAAPEIRDLGLVEVIEAEPTIASRLHRILSTPNRLPKFILNQGKRHAA